MKPSPNGEFELHHWRTSRRKQSSLRRRAAVPAMLDVGQATDDGDGDGDGDGGGEFALRRWRSANAGYTSIRDLLASSPSAAAGFVSPTGGSIASASDIQIKNPLLKQAAFAYLQPTPSTIESSRHRRGRLRRALALISLRSCFGLIGRFLRTICSGRDCDSSCRFHKFDLC